MAKLKPALKDRNARKIILRRTLQGMMMGSGAPLGWALIQSLRGIDLADDIAANTILYLYMLLATMSVFAGFGFYVGRQEGQMQQRALRDTLTGLYNLRHFRDRLDSEITDARRQATPLSLIFFDLDHFKRVNDTYGHAAGDVVLAEISRTVSDVLRRNELLARIGGEEFAILLPHTELEQASNLADRILETLRHAPIDIGTEQPLTVTMSLGVVELAPGEQARAFVERADEAMYQAKENGRNQSYIAPAKG